MRRPRDVATSHAKEREHCYWSGLSALFGPYDKRHQRILKQVAGSYLPPTVKSENRVESITFGVIAHGPGEACQGLRLQAVRALPLRIVEDVAHHEHVRQHAESEAVSNYGARRQLRVRGVGLEPVNTQGSLLGIEGCRIPQISNLVLLWWIVRGNYWYSLCF